MRISTDVPSNIGKIVVNLQSLEFSLRLVLNELQRRNGATKSPEIDLMKKGVGEWIQEDYFTNYDTLNILIKKINSELEFRSLSERIDDSMVELRDTIAHGRILALNPEGPYRILKFSRPKDKKVRDVVSTAWIQVSSATGM
jgi:hypothetical protein